MENNYYIRFEKTASNTSAVVYHFFADIAKKGKGIFSMPIELVEQGKSSFAFKECPGIVFGINSPSFCKAFYEITNGEGSEKDKINTLHSSSLLGLLTFYKMKEEGRRLKINLNNIEFEFERVLFEKTNKVILPSIGLSSIDIALYGYANGKKCVLYLESKFSEFLNRGDCVSSDKKHNYKPYYDCILKNNDIDIIHYYNEKGRMVVASKDGNHYCEGLKQMVSHYIGALNSDDRKEYDIYLAPIIFDFSDTGLASAKFFCQEDISTEDYKLIFPRLAKALNNSFEKLNTINPNNYKRFDHNVKVLDSVITYQDFFKRSLGLSLDSVVKEFYSL